MKREITIRDVFAQLTKECGYSEGKSIFEWYCSAYNVDIASNAPSRVKAEVFDIQ